MIPVEFREALAEKIVEEEQQAKRGRSSLKTDPLWLQQRHFPEHVPTIAKNGYPSRRCVVCSKHKIWTFNIPVCTGCDVGLGAVSCFKIFPRKKIIRQVTFTKLYYF